MVGHRVEANPVSNSEAEKQVVQHLIERVWRQGQVDELPTFWTADCVNHADPAPEKRGLVALRKYHQGFAEWFLAFENVEIDVQQQIAETDRVATQMLLRALHKGKQRNISLATIRIDRFVAGRIAEHWSIADMAGLVQQLA